MQFTIFTDGASRGNPGPGGWGAIVVLDDTVTEIGGREDGTTNNRMEIQAAVEALKVVPEGAVGKLFTDSAYLLNGATKWIFGWQKNNWRTTTKKDVLNRDIWEDLAEAMEGKKIEWHRLSGHSGIPANERCDRIATACADKTPIQLFHGSTENYRVNIVAGISITDDGKVLSKKSKSSGSKKSSGPAYSYVSMVNGKLMTHKTWAECEKRVKGVSGARYKKASSFENEQEIIAEFS